MEKVKVTREQAEAIEEIREKLHEMGLFIDDLKKASIHGYEVEPEFKVGDWVYHEKWGIGEVTGFELHKQETTIWAEMNQMKLHDHLHNFRLATPSEIAEEKERRWWAKHGRDVGKFKRKDLLKLKKNNDVIEFWGYDQGAVEYFHGGTLYRGNQLGFLNEIEVLCFAESRLDVKENE